MPSPWKKCGPRRFARHSAARSLRGLDHHEVDEEHGMSRRRPTTLTYVVGDVMLRPRVANNSSLVLTRPSRMTPTVAATISHFATVTQLANWTTAGSSAGNAARFIQFRKSSR